MFTIGLLARLLFSALVDADRMSAAGRGASPNPDWRTLSRRLEDRLARFDQNSEMDAIRKELSDACHAFARRGKGMYKLSALTGGGKTLASLRYALHHAQRHGMNRIIYVIPYTSIIEQNAETVRAILERKGEPPVVLEHHSNVVRNEEADGREERASLLAENWDAPIVFTTSVQFLNALFDGSTRSSRRMHRLSNAVVIFDEVQTLPVKTIHLFNIAANFLVEFCGSTLLMCTATQPLLDGVNEGKGAARFTGTGGECEIFQGEGDTQRFRRVEVVDRCSKAGWGEGAIVDFILAEAERSGNVLAVTNTRTWAKKLFEQCSPRHEAVFHLSAAMCPAHRSDILCRIRERIDPERRLPAVCISTQLIEAGVDVDFNAGVRFRAGLDSMAQAAGRVNRNGRLPLGRMTIVNPAQEPIARLKDIREGIDKAKRVLKEFADHPERFDDDILSPKLMERYYQYYFYDRAEEMVYPVPPGDGLSTGDSLFSLLSYNTKALRQYMQSHGDTRPPYPFRHAFKTAGRLFQALESPTSAVIVPYGDEGRGLVAQLCSSHYDPALWRGLLRRAQRFAVNLYPPQVQALDKQGALHIADEESGIMVLDDRFYCGNLGVVLEPTATMPLLTG
jgi:CRISPR-associated endonuclease/helicase Cas3